MVAQGAVGVGGDALDNGEVLLGPRRMAPARPAAGATVYRGTGVRMSRAPHRPRPVSVTMTVVLAVVAALIAAWLVTLAQSRSSAAQTYPVGPVRLVVGFPAGGPVDIAARVIAPWLTERLGQPVIVENLSGESGNGVTS